MCQTRGGSRGQGSPSPEGHVYGTPQLYWWIFFFFCIYFAWFLACITTSVEALVLEAQSASIAIVSLAFEVYLVCTHYVLSMFASSSLNHPQNNLLLTLVTSSPVLVLLQDKCVLPVGPP